MTVKFWSGYPTVQKWDHVSEIQKHSAACILINIIIIIMIIHIIVFVCFSLVQTFERLVWNTFNRILRLCFWLRSNNNYQRFVGSIYLNIN